MDGFKNTSKMRYMMGGPVDGYAKGGAVRSPQRKAEGGRMAGTPTAEEVKRSKAQDESLRRVTVSPKERTVLESAQRTEGQSVQTKTGMQKKAMGGLAVMPRGKKC